PQGFGFFLPTFWYLKSEFLPHQQYSLTVFGSESSPKEYFVVVPARAAYSHSASVGRRTILPRSISLACCKSFAASSQNRSASSNETISTEFRAPFQRLGLFPITACHRFCGTSY